jgi:ATP-binding cassette subfamily B protein
MIIYGSLFWLTRQALERNSQQIAYAQTQRLKTLQEGLGGIRDILLGAYQSTYIEIYRQADLSYRRADGSSNIIALSPRHAVEALSMVLVVILAFIVSRQPGGIVAAVGVIGALVVGAQRLLPALQQIYNNLTAISGSRNQVVGVLDLLDQPMQNDVLFHSQRPLDFKRDIRFDSVGFSYSHEGPMVLDGLNLTIPRGARIGFVGRTGSGKSTAMDLFMGLLTPTTGRILVDDLPLNDTNMRAWQRIIAHVPQSIYLTDATLAENIAFGEPPGTIDMDQVKRVAHQACIAEFIERCPEGYNTVVGERGVRLSGGQRQRIGIARALYKQATVLVFDEATSALDNATEQVVMDAIEKLGRDLTIIIIAHRLTTVRRCDMIVELDKGRVVTQGTYEQLVEFSPSFRAMAQIMGKAK